MTGRAALVAWANGEGSDDAIKSAILAAERAASDDIDGDGEHAVFINELIARLGLKRPNGRPAKAIDYAALQSVIAETGIGSDAALKKAVGKRFEISPNTAQKHIAPAVFVPKLLRQNGLDSLVTKR